MRIEPTSRFRGEITLPGDKSISHRYAILAAMAEGTSRISNFSMSQDCLSTVGCLESLGIGMSRTGRELTAESRGWRALKQPASALDAGNSGTTIRLLSALLAASSFRSTIQGDASLNKRPMKRITEPLGLMGAKIETSGGGTPPLRISGTRLQGIRFQLPIPSAQVKSCILLAGLMAEGSTTVIETSPSRDHTERALPFFGAALHQDRPGEFTVRGPSSLKAARMQVPGDFSAAVFFIVAALLVPGARVRLAGVGINPSRTALLNLLEDSGAAIQKASVREENGEPACDLEVGFSPSVFDRFPGEIGGDLLPNLIDEIPALAILGTRMSGGLRIVGAEELRRKESDRIHALAFNLKNLGIQVEESRDGLWIPPGQTIRGGLVKTFGDHRIAMAFSIAGLIAQEGIEVDDPDCAAVSFPDFYQTLQSISAGE